MTKTKITESMIRSSVRSLSRPGTENEIQGLCKMLAGRSFLGPPHAAISAIVDALNQKRGEAYGKQEINLVESVKVALDVARTMHGEVYSVRYVHAISPSMKDVGGDITLPAGAFSSSSTLAKALRKAGVLLSGGRIRNFRVEGDKVIVFPGKNSTGGGGNLTSNWHSIILTHVSQK